MAPGEAQSQGRSEKEVLNNLSTRSFLISESLITCRKIRFTVAHEVSPKAEPLPSEHRLWGFFF